MIAPGETKLFIRIAVLMAVIGFGGPIFVALGTYFSWI